MILTLHAFWAAQGCLILQPYDMRMGAGTFHTATTLRALGPEPWNAAFVQPCAAQNAWSVRIMSWKLIFAGWLMRAANGGWLAPPQGFVHRNAA